MVKYSMDDLERMLAFRWDEFHQYGPSNTAKPEDDMPGGSAAPAKSGGWVAELADLDLAWRHAGLSGVQARRVVMRYGLGWSWNEVASHEGVSSQSVWESVESAMVKLLDVLNTPVAVRRNAVAAGPVKLAGGMLPVLVVYGKDDCQPCKATVRMLERAGVTFQYFMFAESVEAHGLASAHGVVTAPLVHVSRDGVTVDVWGGFNPGKLKRYVGELGLAVADADGVEA